ncbi:tol-pal system YbgF family protein [Aquabacterium sp.]|uniref:tetratricopeptide repeat protein n=1 Tax=Aquabacterium sp. TaxID=1872578 RepID=UPI0037842454
MKSKSWEGAPLAPWVAVLGLAAASAPAAAQLIDELELRREGNDAVLQLRFTTEVQFQRAISTRSGDVTQLIYTLLTTTNGAVATPMQVLRLRAARGVPELEVSDEPERAERGEQTRRVLLRSREPLVARARAGKGNRSLEIVLVGKGSGLPLPPPGPAARRPAPAVAAASAPAATGPAAPAAAPAPTAPAAPAAASPLPSQAPPEVEARATALLAQARTAFEAGRIGEAIDQLNVLLELPPNSATREGQELAGRAHLQAGDTARARAEFETYLQLFPQGEGSERVRALLAGLPKPSSAPAAPVAAPLPAEPEITTSGSASVTHYGGNGQVRSRDFLDSPIAGLPQVAGDPQLSADRTRQLYSDVDLNWRRRNTEVEQRFVFREAYTRDELRPEKSRNRLSALYFDHKSLTGGWNVRLGRQSPTGGGVMGRFDGLKGSWSITPRVKLGAVAGLPTDKYFDSNRRFYGVSLDAERLPGGFGVGAYAIEQRIDSEIDRRAVGLDLRWFQGGSTVFSQFDYDLLMRGLNVATVQATFITEGNTVYNALYDRRTLSTLALGNALTFEDPANPGVLFSRIQDRLASTTVEALRRQVKRITPMITQAQLGVTRPFTKNWQGAASIQLTNTGAIPPVPEVAGFENGRPATGNVITTSAQLIGLNLYSARDTHVLSTSVISSPSLHGLLLGYNNASLLYGVWQVEPSLQFYRDRLSGGSHSRRWTPGLRISWRGWQRWAIESNLTYEIGRATRVSTAGSTTEESVRRVNYSLGVRYEF